MILNKDLSNISHMFQNCAKLIKLSIYDDILIIDNEKSLDNAENNNDNNYSFDYSKSNSESHNDLYKNLEKNDTSPNYLEITNITERNDEDKMFIINYLT